MIGMNAQSTDDCGTTSDMQTTSLQHLQNQSQWPSMVDRRTTVNVPIQIHIIGSTSGAFSIDSFLVFDEIESVNEHYAEANINFFMCGPVNNIGSNAHLTFTKGDEEDLCDIHDVDGAINIYFAPNLENQNGESLCGYAYNYDIKNRVLMDNGCSTNGSTLSHELGHSFSLLHTHSTSNGRELADGSNCQTAGDLLCDTPADPRLSSDLVNSNCEYTGTDVDSQNNPYNPDPTNIMSYSRKNCRTFFSESQLLQMQAFHFANSQLLTCENDPISNTNNQENKTEYAISPNPFNTFFTIKKLNKNDVLTIYSTTGERIKQIEFSDIVYNYQLNCSAFSSGMYMVVISNGQNNYIEKLIKY